MPIPVIIFLLVFSFVTVALPAMAVRAYRSGVLNGTDLYLSWMPLVAWLVTPIMVALGGQTPPSRSTSVLIAVVLLLGMAAAVFVAMTKGAPRTLRKVAWACALGLLLRAAFAAVAAFRLLPP